jgi:hypothetical protein
MLKAEKMENGTRQPSDLLLTNLVAWLVKDRYIKKNESGLLLDELLTLKYMGHLSPFVRDLARRHHDLHFVQSHSLLKVAEHPKE